MLHFSEEAFICNIIIIMCVNYIFIIRKNVNEVINKKYERLQNLILRLGIPIGTPKEFFSKFTDSLGTRPQKVSPALGCAMSEESFRA